MKKVVIVSGGLDSTVLLYMQVAQHGAQNIKALSFDYGQRHSREVEFACWHCEKLCVPWSLVDHTVAVPEGHYSSTTMKKTVVPNRNMIMLSIAAGHAIALGADAIVYGAHIGDHAIYPDCRPEFTSAVGKAIALADWHEVRLEQPFLDDKIDKAGIVSIAQELGVDVTRTWSCYCGNEIHCGNCGTCTERREAFFLANVDDPTPYDNLARELADLLSEKD